MDSINREKIQALKKHKQQKLPRTLVFYPLAVLTCGLVCTTLFWFPSLYSSTKTFFHVSVPRVLSLFFNAKSLFILGNLIVIFLVQDSKGRLSNDSPNNRNNHLVKTTVPDKVAASLEVKMYTLFSRKSSKTVSERLLQRRTCEDLSLEPKVECLEEVGRDEKLAKVGRKTMQEEEKVGLLCQSDEEQGENLENSIEQPMIIPALSTDELKRRADDFIARVNKQIRLEANQVLVY